MLDSSKKVFIWMAALCTWHYHNHLHEAVTWNAFSLPAVPYQEFISAISCLLNVLEILASTSSHLQSGTGKTSC